MNFALETRKVGGITVIWFNGEVDIKAVPAIKSQVDKLLASGQKKMIIEVSRTAFIDSDGLGLLIDIHEKCGNDNMTVVCTNNPKVRRNFELLRLVERFGVHDNIKAALVVLKTER